MGGVLPDDDPVGGGRVGDPQRLVDQVAAADEQVAAERPERPAQIGERLRQERPPVRTRPTVHERVVEDEERHDYPSVGRRCA